MPYLAYELCISGAGLQTEIMLKHSVSFFGSPFYFRKKLIGAQIDEEMVKCIARVTAMERGGVVGYQLSPQVFVIKDRVTSLSPMGWVHVYKTDLGKIECSLR